MQQDPLLDSYDVPSLDGLSGHQYSQNIIRGNARVQFGDTHNRVPLEREDKAKKAKERGKLFDWLSQISAWDRYNEVVSQHKQGTSDWLFNDWRYSRWMSNFHSSLLWLNGKMGSGKSMLTAVVLRKLLSDSTVRILFFFCDRTNRSAQLEDSINIYRSLLRQMLQEWQEEETGDLAESLIKLKQGNRFLLASDCRHLLIETIRAMQDKKEKIEREQGKEAPWKSIVVILDALDECSPELQRDLMFDWIHPLLEKTDVKVFLASRPETDVTPFLRDMDPRTETLNIGKSNSEDIKTFVRIEIGRLNLRNVKQGVEALLIERSDGMFRWVQLAIRFLQARRSAKESLELLRDLRSLPPGLPELYERIYDQILRYNEYDRGLVSRAFAYVISDAWVYPLSSIEFVEAVYGGELLEDPLCAISELLLLCSDFLEQDEEMGRIRLSHLSVKEFLERKATISDLGNDISLAKLCIKIARNFLENENDRAWQLGRFICYAITYWPSHLEQLGKNRLKNDSEYRSSEMLVLILPNIDAQLVDLLFRKLHYSSRSFNSWKSWVQALLIFNPIAKKEKSSIQKYRIPNSHEDFVSQYEDEETEGFILKISRPSYRSTILEPWWLHEQSHQSNPLFVYACLGVKEITKVKTPLNDIAYHAINDVVSMPLDFLKKEGFHKHDQFHSLFGNTKEAASTNKPLSHVFVYWARLSGDPATFRKMVKMSHNLENVDGRGSTIIHDLAGAAAFDLLNSALSKGGDVNWPDWRGRTPLFYALYNGAFTAAELLLTRKADINSQDHFGLGCLHWAILGLGRVGPQSYTSPTSVRARVEWLLHRGANADLVSVGGQSMLIILFSLVEIHKIRAEDIIWIATCLMQQGTDLWQISYNGMTAHGILSKWQRIFRREPSHKVHEIARWFDGEMKKKAIIQIMQAGSVPRCQPRWRLSTARSMAANLKSQILHFGSFNNRAQMMFTDFDGSSNIGDSP
ncbi:MAG: hypothetical protein Q9160_003229 [Pyrenula sp. 1 TL-2023]